MAQESLTLTPAEFDVSRLVLEKPVANEKRKNVYSARLKYLDETDEKRSFYLQTPKLFTPFGASSYNDDDKYSLAVKLGSDGKEAEFKQVLIEMENKVEELVKGIKTAIKKNEFTKMVKVSKTDPEKYDPTMTIKLKSNPESGELYADVFNNKREKLMVTLENIVQEIPARSKVRGLLMMNTVWFVNKNCGVTINAKQLLIYANKEQKCMFGPLSDDEDDDEEDTKKVDMVDSEEDDE